MADAPVLFVDSGIGGLPYVEEVRRYLHGGRVVYVADTAHFPYGERTGDEIRGIVVDLVERSLESFAPKLIVIACNTATVVALEALRSRFRVPFVGVVPAVKPAALSAGGGPVTVLSTARTADAEYLSRLIESYAGNKEVRIVAAGGLVSFVEHRLAVSTAEERQAAVSQALSDGASGWTDAGSVVLGCTHFTHLSREIEHFLGPSVNVVDSRRGVARRVGELLSTVIQEDAGNAGAESEPVGEFFVTDEWPRGESARERYRDLVARYGLTYNGLYSWMRTH